MASVILLVLFVFWFSDGVSPSAFKYYVPYQPTAFTEQRYYASKDDASSLPSSYGKSVSSKGNYTTSAALIGTASTRHDAWASLTGGQLTYGLGEPYFYSYAHDGPLLWSDVDKYVNSAILPKPYRFSGSFQVCSLL